jgi:polygalacturonase
LIEAMTQTTIHPAIDGESTDRIQAALNVGGRVVLAAGKHLSRALRMGSECELHLADGAELVLVPDYEAGAKVDLVAENSDRAMIVASAARNLAITGRGRIVCGGTAAFTLGDEPGMGTLIPAERRPRVLVFDGCENVRITGVTIVDSPMWTLHFVACTQLDVVGIRIDNNRRLPNTDGIVLDGCRDVTVTDCDIRTADDGVVLKTSLRRSGTPVGPCRAIRVSACTVESRSCALKIGTESYSDFEDILFEDCSVEASNRALGVFSRDGGAMRRVRFARIDVDCRETPEGFWGSGEALTVTVLNRRPGGPVPVGRVEDLVVEDITGTMEGVVTLYGERPGDIGAVTLSRIALVRRVGALGTARLYDLRPTPADLAPIEPGGEGRANSWRKDATGRVAGLHPYPAGFPVLFTHNVTDLSLDAVSIVQD